MLPLWATKSHYVGRSAGFSVRHHTFWLTFLHFESFEVHLLLTGEVSNFDATCSHPKCNGGSDLNQRGLEVQMIRSESKGADFERHAWFSSKLRNALHRPYDLLYLHTCKHMRDCGFLSNPGSSLMRTSNVTGENTHTSTRTL